MDELRKLTIEDRRKIDEEIFKLCEKSYTDGYFDGQKDRDMDIPPSIDDAYRRGYADAEKKHNSDLDYKNGLEDGRMEAWECAKKIYKMTASEIITVFGGCSNWVDYSVDEAIEKIKEYEDNQTDDVNITALKAVCEDLSDARGSDFSGVIALEKAIKVLEQMEEKANEQN